MKQACKLIDKCKEECFCKTCLREECPRRRSIICKLDDLKPITNSNAAIFSLTGQDKNSTTCFGHKSFTDKIRRRI